MQNNLIHAQRRASMAANRHPLITALNITDIGRAALDAHAITTFLRAACASLIFRFAAASCFAVRLLPPLDPRRAAIVETVLSRVGLPFDFEVLMAANYAERSACQ